MLALALRTQSRSFPTSRLVSAEELLNHPEWGYCELVRGKVVPVTPPQFEHGILISWLTFKITAFVARKKLGKVTAADAGIFTGRKPDTVRGADVAFFSNARLKKEPRPVGYSTIPPDLCVEVISPGDRFSDLTDKIDEYLAAGVRLVWVIDPVRNKAHVYSPGQPARLLQGKDKLSGEDVLPGFKLALNELFAQLN